jgi:hypothetical protein
LRWSVSRGCFGGVRSRVQEEFSRELWMNHCCALKPSGHSWECGWTIDALESHQITRVLLLSLGQGWTWLGLWWIAIMG